MSGGVKRKLDNQSIERKYEIIRQLETGTKPADLSRQHGIPANTISGWKKKADVIKQMYEKSVFDPARKKLRAAEHKDVDDAVFQWVTDTRASNLPVNGPLLMEQADIVAAQLGHPDFKARQGWLDRFKKRHNIVFKGLVGDRSAVQHELVDSWLKTQTLDAEHGDTFRPAETVTKSTLALQDQIIKVEVSAEDDSGGPEQANFYHFDVAQTGCVSPNQEQSSSADGDGKLSDRCNTSEATTPGSCNLASGKRRTTFTKWKLQKGAIDTSRTDSPEMRQYFINKAILACHQTRLTILKVELTKCALRKEGYSDQDIEDLLGGCLPRQFANVSDSV